MTTVADFTTRTRGEMYSVYQAYQALARRVDDLVDEVTALGGAVGIYGANGVDFPAQSDGFDFAALAAAFSSLPTLVGVPTDAQKAAVIKARRS